MSCSNPTGGTVEAATPSALTRTTAAPQSRFRLGSPTPEMAPEFVRRCQNASRDSVECDVFRTVLVFELTRTLQKSEIAKDQRAIPQALAALSLTEEPEILIAASRILGRFPETPDLAAKMLPLMLGSAYVQVQSRAAQVLTANPNPEFGDLGRQWIEGHSELRSTGPYDESPDFPKHYVSMGFPKYAGAEWFSPLDSDRSIGWAVKADAAAVAKWYGDTLHTEVLDGEKWNDVYMQQTKLLLKFDQSRMEHMQQLLERAQRGDSTAMTELQKLQKQIDAEQKDVEAAMERSVSKAAIVPGPFAADARWIIAAKKGERISRLIVIFSIPTLQLTAIREVWDLSDFPSAWPALKSRINQ